MAPAAPSSRHVTVLSRCEVSPSPPAPVPGGQPRALPLTFFDLVFWGFPPVQRLFFYDDPAGLVDAPGFLARDLPLFKDSLAAALHRFYPLAGKLPCELPPEEDAEGPEVVCSDGDSVRLTVAVAGGGDADFRDLAGDQPRDTARLRPLLPPLPERGSRSRDVFAVQLTVFPRAGICVGTTLHHAVADGSGYAHFVRTWAAFHRLGPEQRGAGKKSAIDVAQPLLDRGAVRDEGGRLREAFLRDHRALADAGDTRLGDWDLGGSVLQGGVQVQLATFRFTGELLRKLGRRVEAETSARGCSPYAVACGAAWAGIAHARGTEEEGAQQQHFGFVTGCKPRASPPVPASYFGNCLGLCRVRVEGKEGEELTASAASAAIWREIEALAEPGRALRGARGWVRWVRESAAARAVTVAGSPKLGMYAAADMGAPWGRPRKVEIASVERTGGALALAEDAGGGAGIEVGVALPSGQMEAFRAFFSDLVASSD